MDIREALLQILAMGGLRALRGGHGQRAHRQDSPRNKPTAERVKQRQAEQERRRREAVCYLFYNLFYIYINYLFYNLI